MTLPVRRAVIRPSFASIADTLREEFANKGLRLYESIYIDIDTDALAVLLVHVGLAQARPNKINNEVVHSGMVA